MDLGIEKGLESRSDIIRMIVLSMAMATMVMVVVIMTRHFEGIIGIDMEVVLENEFVLLKRKEQDQEVGRRRSVEKEVGVLPCFLSYWIFCTLSSSILLIFPKYIYLSSLVYD